jgi:hypothetical protein
LGLAKRTSQFQWYLVMNATKDALKNAKGFKYDRSEMKWVPEESPLRPEVLRRGIGNGELPLPAADLAPRFFASKRRAISLHAFTVCGSVSCARHA